MRDTGRAVQEAAAADGGPQVAQSSSTGDVVKACICIFQAATFRCWKSRSWDIFPRIPS